MRSFARACTLTAAWSLAFGASACSLLLDWNGYTGGGFLGHDASTGGDDATSDDAADNPDAADANREADAASRDATDGADASDAATPPKCGPTTCGGCCNSATGFCAGGGSQTTCGTGGEACRDCASLGESCDQGECSASVDSGPPPVCNAVECNMIHSTPMSMSLCIPVYEGACCKTDGTCGCQILIPPGPCM